MDTNKIINSRSLSFMKEFSEKQFPDFKTNGKEDVRSKYVTYELKPEVKKREIKRVKISEEEFQKLDPKVKETENNEYFKLVENVIWGYSSDGYDHPALFEELKLFAVHAKMCVVKVPADAGCRFFIGKYMRKSKTSISPPQDDVALRAIFNFNFDEIYKLSPKYKDDAGKNQDSGLDSRELLIKKDTLEIIGPYSLAKYTINVSANTTQTKKTTPLRGGSNTKLRPGNYERITVVADFWYQPEFVDRLDDMISQFLNDDNNEMAEVLKGLGIKTNHSINKKIIEEKKKLANRTRDLSANNLRAEREFDELAKGINGATIDNSFFE